MLSFYFLYKKDDAYIYIYVFIVTRKDSENSCPVNRLPRAHSAAVSTAGRRQVPRVARLTEPKPRTPGRTSAPSRGPSHRAAPRLRDFDHFKDVLLVESYGICPSVTAEVTGNDVPRLRPRRCL